ncbi:hypothetical protein [Pseudobacteriovorax antillogorgiicola]|uniref:Uncharacterized protein n=1 Tax=Pseudobacteriovorax antillogorgiicola TaxID=1513793 RepID=A0A1Y6CPM8_9BACT|nr:hypothetical protein [Pseudobacteriovorax antillogorgiicola]TCS44250.1 hypothetical protein EDD56_13450 [Pseudobacteriovorax antillogorgiicola]SMF80742.1 hypothetical protein SAMN06296036_13551 [Pseudobacteriovorax antillogorgiicola]
MQRDVSQAEFAKLIGVSKAAITQQISSGKRLNKSISRSNGKVSIDIVKGILEWFGNADQTKYRKGQQNHSDLTKLSEGIMDPKDSNAMKIHYSALNEKLEYESEAKILMPKEKIRNEVFQSFRGLRDNLLNTPNEISGDLRRSIDRFLDDEFGDNTSTRLSKDVETIITEARRSMAGEIKKLLSSLSDAIEEVSRA